MASRPPYIDTRNVARRCTRFFIGDKTGDGPDAEDRAGVAGTPAAKGSIIHSNWTLLIMSPHLLDGTPAPTSLISVPS